MAQAYVEIPLTKGMVALVSLADADKVRQYRWRASASAGKMETGPHYALTGASGDCRFYMHQLIAGGPSVDHINGDTLDNRRENLRVATSKENAANKGKPHGRSRYKGVIQRTAHPGVYFVEVREGRHGEFYFQGRFYDEVEAAQAFDAAVRKFKPGPYQRFNFPRPGERGLDGELRTI